MIKRILLICIALLLPWIGSALSQTTGSAPTSRSQGLDVVILVDQSGSMWGHREYHPIPNDRDEHRITGVQAILVRLAEHVEATTFVHRVSVIDFGDNAEVALSNFELRFDPVAPGEQIRRAEATASTRLMSKPWVNTNTPEAMQMAAQEFAGMAGSTAQTSRRKVMLILTDGRANKPPASLDIMKNRVREQARVLKQQGVEIYVIGLNNADDYWLQGDGTFWEEVAETSANGQKRARLAERASKHFATILQGIVDEWLGVKSEFVPGESYDCPPYLRRIVFSITFGTPGSPVNILDPDSNRILTSFGGGISNPSTFVRVVVDDPKPGKYTIDKDPSRMYTAFVEEHSAHIQRLTPVSDIGLNVPSLLVFQASNADGKPLLELPDWPITAIIDLTEPSGTRRELPSSYVGDGKFEASLTPTEGGLYHARLKGVITFNGQPYDIFEANARSYDEEIRVSNIQPYALRFENVNPVSGVRVWPFSKYATLSFELVDPRGDIVLDVASVVSNPETWLSMEVIDEAGIALEGPLPLTYNTNGTFEVSVPIDLTWIEGEGVWFPDKLSVRLLPQPDRFTGDNVLQSLVLPEEAQDNRIGSDPLTAGPLAVAYSTPVRLALGIMALILLGAIAFYIFRKWGARLFILWADSSRGRRVEVRVYEANADPTGIVAKRFPISYRSEFKFDRELKVEQEEKEVVASTLRVKRAVSIGDVSAEVKYSWNDDPKKIYTLQLRSGKAKRLKGLERGNYVMSLETKRA